MKEDGHRSHRNKSKHIGKELPSISETSLEMLDAISEKARPRTSDSKERPKSRPRSAKRNHNVRRGSQLSVKERLSDASSNVKTRDSKLRSKTKGLHASKLEEGFSRKYLKMKYEIELQNFAIDKINRELQVKFLQCCPEPEVRQLKHRLGLELHKLCQMVEMAISAQRHNPSEKWGPIPISTIGEAMKISPPHVPSGISNVSGFNDLKDLREDQGRCLKIETEKLRALRKLKETSRDEFKTKHLSDSIGETMNELLTNMDAMKTDIKSLRQDLKNMKHKSSQN